MAILDRSWKCAAILSVMFPGWGQLYNGQGLKALAFSFGSLGVITLAFVLLAGSFFGMLCTLGVAVLIWSFSIFDAVRNATISRPGHPKWFMKSWGYLLLAVIAIVGQPLVKATIRGRAYEAFRVPIGFRSMEPTLVPGDHIMVEKGYFLHNSPKHGDLAVVDDIDDPWKADPNEKENKSVRRIIGLPGDTIEIKGTKVFRNGALLEEPYLKLSWEHSQKRGPYEVPPGKVYVLGDNRDYSRDSRFSSNPFVDQSTLLAKILYIYWSHSDKSRIGSRCE